MQVTGTILQSTRTDLRKWLLAIWRILDRYVLYTEPAPYCLLTAA